jgi:hypothetical protein
MPQIFHPSMNTVSRVSIFGAVFIVAAVFLIVAMTVRSPYFTGERVVHNQPVPFSHEHHVGDCGIDCRYCHTSVETSAVAGVPSTKTCMNCHSQLFADSPMLAPVRESFRDKQPLVWTRVHDVPDFAYFNHSIHVQKGIGCTTCHGAVHKMPLMWREQTLHMQWCVDCHRRPEDFVRPRDEVFNVEWAPELLSADELQSLAAEHDLTLNLADREEMLRELRRGLAQKHHLQSKDSCYTCHR